MFRQILIISLVFLTHSVALGQSSKNQDLETANEKANQGEKEYLAKNYQKAYEFFQDAILLNPNHTSALVRIGSVLFLQKDYVNSEQAFLIALKHADHDLKRRKKELSEINITAETATSHTKHLEQKKEKKEAEIKESLSHRITSEHFLGRIYFQQRRLEKAKIRFERVIISNEALELKEKNWQVYWDMARVHSQVAQNIVYDRSTKPIDVKKFKSFWSHAEITQNYYERAFNLITELKKEELLRGQKKISVAIFLVAYSEFLQSQSDIVEDFISKNPMINSISTPDCDVVLSEVLLGNARTAEILLSHAERLQPREPEVYLAKVRSLMRVKGGSHNTAIKEAQDKAWEKGFRFVSRIRKHPKKEKYLALYAFTRGLVEISRGHLSKADLEIGELESLIAQVLHPKYYTSDKTAFEIRQQQEAVIFIKRLHAKLKARR